MSDGKRLSHILDFLLLTDRFKTIERKGYIADGSRRETDAEHTWHMGLFALLLHKELGFDVDLGHVLTLVLIHDLEEIHAGDTYAYDDAGCAGQADREAEAARKLFAELPADLGASLLDWWREFEEGATPEARFAKAIDRLQGFSQNYNSGGRAWRENGISRERTYQRTALPISVDPALKAIVEELYSRADSEKLWPDKP